MACTETRGLPPLSQTTGTSMVTSRIVRCALVSTGTSELKCLAAVNAPPRPDSWHHFGMLSDLIEVEDQVGTLVKVPEYRMVWVI